jgi:hypothetical protein
MRRASSSDRGSEELEVVTEVLLEQKKIEGRFGKKTLMVCVPSRTMEV